MVSRRQKASTTSDPSNYDFGAALGYFAGIKEALQQVVIEPQPNGKQ